MTTITDVKDLHATFTLAAGNAEKLRDERNAAIRLLVAEGMRVSDVARALNVTRARIAQIVEK